MPPKVPVLQWGDIRTLQRCSSSLWEQGPSGAAQRAGTVPARDPELLPELPGRQRRLRAASARPVSPGSPFSRTESSWAKPHLSRATSPFIPHLGTKRLRGRATCGSRSWWHHGCSARCSRLGSGGRVRKTHLRGFYFLFFFSAALAKGLRAPRAPRGAVPGASPGSGGTRGAGEPPRAGGPPESWDSPRQGQFFPAGFPAAPLIRRTLRAGTPGRPGWVSAPCPTSSPPRHPARRRRARRAPAGPARAARCGPSAR